MKLTRQFALVLLCCVLAFAGLTVFISYQVLSKMQESAALNFLETTSRFADSIMNDQTHEFEAVGAALLAASSADILAASNSAAADADASPDNGSGATDYGASESSAENTAGTAAEPKLLPELKSLQKVLPTLSFAILVNGDGRQIGATEDVRPSAGKLFARYLEQLQKNDQSFIGSMDVFALDDLFMPRSEQLDKYLVDTNGEGQIDEALANIAVIGTTDKQLFLVLGEVVNNGLHYPEQYSNQVNGSFLSYVVGNHRIATNLATNTSGQSQLGTAAPLDVAHLPEAGYLGKELSPAGYYYYYLYTPVENYWGDNIAAKAVGIRENVYSSLIHNNMWAIVMVTLVAIPVLLVVAQLLSRRISHPLRTSKRMAEAVMAGDFEAVQRFPVPENPINEAEQLVASLHTMATNLDESQQRARTYMQKLQESERSAHQLSQQLMEANENLEATVDARTLELRQLVDELSISNSTKTRFIANISHELKTPLTSSISAADLLLDEIFGPLNEKQREYLNTILMSSSHLLMLINDILSLAKIEEGGASLSCETLSVKDIVEGVVRIVLGTYPQRADDISIQIEPPDLTVTADPAALRQILFNLLTNAAKFSDTGSPITVRATASVAAAKPVVLFAVEDHGIGIAEADFERVFYEFEQVDNSYSRTYEGTGLGLPIARRQTELHNGRLWLKSELGKGTSIEFFLPLTQEANGQEGTEGAEDEDAAEDLGLGPADEGRTESSDTPPNGNAPTDSAPRTASPECGRTVTANERTVE